MARCLQRIARFGLFGTLPITIAILTLPGCGKTGSVHGKVYYKDKALTNGMVTFVADNKTAGSATIQPDGSFAMANVPAGEVTILVTTGITEPTKSAAVTIPKEFSDPAKSKEKYTVATGDQEKDIHLK
jgi:hypothetical protein